MIIKLVEDKCPESLGNIVYIKGLEKYLVDVSKEDSQYVYSYDTSSEEVEVEPNQLFAIFVKSKSDVEDTQILKFYMCALSEEAWCGEGWAWTGFCLGNFEILFKAEGPRVVDRLMTWWERTKEPSLELAKAIALDDLQRNPSTELNYV